MIRPKKVIGMLPIIGPITNRITTLLRRHHFPGVDKYWETRYASGGTSGAGSYGILADFKAKVLNAFAQQNDVRNVIEFGCGDGEQLTRLNFETYTGVDISKSAITRCIKKFSSDPSKRFFHTSQKSTYFRTYDMSLSLDVIYHLIDDDRYVEYMRDLFQHSSLFVAIYSTNYEEYTEAAHVRHRKFTDWIASNAREWRLCANVPNAYPYDPNAQDVTSFAEFYFFEKCSAATSA